MKLELLTAKDLQKLAKGELLDKERAEKLDKALEPYINDKVWKPFKKVALKVINDAYEKGLEAISYEKLYSAFGKAMDKLLAEEFMDLFYDSMYEKIDEEWVINSFKN